MDRYKLPITLLCSLSILSSVILPNVEAAPKKHKRAISTARPSTKQEAVTPKAASASADKSPPRPDINAIYIPGAPPPPKITARAAIVIDARTGKTLYEKNADEHRSVASTTKILTALIVSELGDLDKPVRIEAIDTLCQPSKAYVKAGETYTRRYLLYALMIHSCNDIARALARDTAGSLSGFAVKMNQRSSQLGAVNSVWSTPNGLPAKGEVQYSTARDVARIALAAYNNPIMRDIVRTPRMTFQYNNGRTTEFTNTNRLLLSYPFCNGIKTGYTDAAGHCLVSSAANQQGEVIVVLLGDSKSIWLDSQNMLQWALGAQGAQFTTSFFHRASNQSVR